jgi:hypothetical protein
VIGDQLSAIGLFPPGFILIAMSKSLRFPERANPGIGLRHQL